MAPVAPAPIRIADFHEEWPSSKTINMGFGHLESLLADFAIDVDVDYQREHVWTPEQQSLFVGHALSGGKVLPLVVNDPGREDQRLEMVDGKQRLTAMRLWLANKIPAFVGWKTIWRPDTDGRFRLGHGFEFHFVKLPRIEVLRFYLRLNATGTPHTPAELTKVEQLLLDEVMRLRAEDAHAARET